MAINGFVLSAVTIAAFFMMIPRLANAKWWRATITPLASIIGSGFLVLGPILIASYGLYAPLAMIALCAAAYAFGAAIRYNIRTIDAAPTKRSPLELTLDKAASWALAFAYIISVAYYLNLFGAFGVRLTTVNDALHAKLLTSFMLLLILIVGWTRGYGALERLEQLSVSVKLSIIAGLIAGLVVYFSQKLSGGALIFNPPVKTGWTGITLLFGLIVTVQGFETSRYLGDDYDADTRISSMRRAQWISAAIYVIYIGLLAFAFEASSFKLNETEIIDMMAVVAPILPVLLIAAALSAQFSAAIADTSGAGGLFHEVTHQRLKQSHSYAVLTTAGLILTWSADVFEIISYASRAFALYYALQAAIAAAAANRRSERHLAVLFGALSLLGLTITLFGAPAAG